MGSFLNYISEGSPSASSESAPKIPVSEQQKSTAVHYARNIQYRKSMQDKVLDLIVSTVDLPSHPNADPTRPSASDAELFKKALSLFQPKDFEDSILERNIYEKCGYALCARPNLKQKQDLRDRIWQSMKDSRRTRPCTREELDRWCSMGCLERALFVRLQLGTEPAWLRTTPIEKITFLEESGPETATEDLENTMGHLGLKESTQPDLAASLQHLALHESQNDIIRERMQALSMERGNDDGIDRNGLMATALKEKDVSLKRAEPPNSNSIRTNDSVEGYKPKAGRHEGHLGSK
jgi:Rtr1/RPAP2 family